MDATVTRKEFDILSKGLADTRSELSVTRSELSDTRSKLIRVTRVLDGHSLTINILVLGGLGAEIKELAYRDKKNISKRADYVVPITWHPSKVCLTSLGIDTALYEELPFGVSRLRGKSPLSLVVDNVSRSSHAVFFCQNVQRIPAAHPPTRELSLPVLAMCLKFRHPKTHKKFWPLLKALGKARHTCGPVLKRHASLTDADIYVPESSHLSKKEAEDFDDFLQVIEDGGDDDDDCELTSSPPVAQAAVAGLKRPRGGEGRGRHPDFRRTVTVVPAAARSRSAAYSARGEGAHRMKK
jgi:hypothetical protein